MRSDNVQFFSVDGGHWRDIVVNDLGIAGDAVGERGVIALDDFLHKEWPDVSRGFFDWHRGPWRGFLLHWRSAPTSSTWCARKVLGFTRSDCLQFRRSGRKS